MLINPVEFKQGLSGLLTLNHGVWDFEWKTWKLRTWISWGLFTNISGGYSGCWLRPQLRLSAGTPLQGLSMGPGIPHSKMAEFWGQESQQSRDSYCLPPPSLEIMQHHCCCILPIRSKSLRWTIFKGEELDSILCGKSVKELDFF